MLRYSQVIDNGVSNADLMAQTTDLWAKIRDIESELNRDSRQVCKYAINKL